MKVIGRLIRHYGAAGKSQPILGFGRQNHVIVLLSLPLLVGCGMQSRGGGIVQTVREPATGAKYELYLPKTYKRENERHTDPDHRRWPLVLTLHDLKPWDDARSQEREWEQLADSYGFIVCAPQLQTPDSFMELPLRHERNYVLEDKRNIIAILDHVLATTLADPHRVLCTGTGVGGYLMHYMVNRFPDRFFCMVGRSAHFAPELLTESTLPAYCDRVPTAMYASAYASEAARRESQLALKWYANSRFSQLEGEVIDGIAWDNRLSAPAAAYFAKKMGVTPLDQRHQDSPEGPSRTTELTSSHFEAESPAEVSSGSSALQTNGISTAEPYEKLKVAVLDFSCDGSDASARSVAFAALCRGIVASHHGYAPMPRERMLRLFGHSDLTLPCACDDADCARTKGAQLSVPRLIYGEVLQVGGGVTLRMGLLNTGNGQVTESFRELSAEQAVRLEDWIMSLTEEILKG